MKRLSALVLVVIMVFAMTACGSDAEEKVAKFVDEQGDTFLSSMEYAFATSSGLSCTSSIKAKGTGFEVRININELEDVDSATKQQMQSTADAQSSTMKTALKELQKEVPELTYFKIYICEKDGDTLAVVNAK